MKYADRQIKNVAALLGVLKQRKAKDSATWFRGQADFTWNLIPSISRERDGVDAEIALMKRFKQNAMHFLQSHPATDWDWLFLMQHYGVPTRLLDWTENPLIGLYFAVNEEKHYDKDGVLWGLLPKSLNKQYRPSYAEELPYFGVDDFIDLYLPKNMALERSSRLEPIAAISARESRRLFAQLGVFTITHREVIPIEEAGDKQHVWRLVIPKEEKGNILNELAYLGVNKLALFPELPSVAEIAKEILQ